MADTLTVTGTISNVTVNGVAWGPPVTPPSTAPVLAITSPGGATTTAAQTISGTIDLPNIGVDILVDAGPTSFGTCRAGADGKWSKPVTLNADGMWTITAHATNAVGTTASAPVIFQKTSDGGGTGPSGSPPAPIVRLAAGSNVDQIQAAVTGASSGSIVFAAGTYAFAGRSVRGKPGVTLWADGACTITGGAAAGAFDLSGLANVLISGKAWGQGFVFNGSPVNLTGANHCIVENAIFNGQPSNGFDGSAVRMNGASYIQVWNCDFNNCQGNVLGQYNLDNIAVDGCHFTNCRQPISYQVPTNANRAMGRNCTVRRSTFVGCTRAAMEMGPSVDQPGEYFSGTVVEDCWFDDFNNPDANTNLPISLVGQASENTLVRNNYCSRGMGPNSVGRAAPAIEFTGGGECYDNVTVDFTWAGFTYKSGWNVHHNVHYVTPGQPNYTPQTQGWANNGNPPGTGTFANNVEATTKPPVQPKPARIVR